MTKSSHGAGAELPRRYNAAVDLLERNLVPERAARIAYIDDQGACTYAELAARVDRVAAALTALGLVPEQRVLLAMHDTIDLPSVFLGCIKAGIVPIPVNTLLTTENFEFMLRDSRARALIVSPPLLPAFTPILESVPTLKHVIVAGSDATGHRSLETMLEAAPARFIAAETCCDEVAFWLYSSGSTGAPKGTMHVHGSLIRTAKLYAEAVVGLEPGDVVLSAPKLFFAYGLGNSLTFPLAAGATTVLMQDRPTPEGVFRRLRDHRATAFFGVPTLYASMLAYDAAPQPEELALRTCISAGEPLPADLARRWRERFGTDILDGIGSTEMLHIFISNRPGDIHDGTTGRPVPGYEVRIVDEHDRDVGVGETGELLVSGPTAATGYWNNRERSRRTFAGEWTRTGDQYHVDEHGCFVYAGRADDMIKVSGNWVSPAEVEAALISHGAVLEAAVVGHPDGEGMLKPRAFVVLRQGHAGSATLAADLQQHVKHRLAPYKYPRWVEFIAELPKTATGKIQRFRLRQS